MIGTDVPVLAVLCGDQRPPNMHQIEQLADVRYTDEDGLADALHGADGLFVYDFLSHAVRAAWPAADRLSWVHISAAGVDPVLFPGLVDSDVPLTNSRGVFENPIAEYVLGVIIGFAKDFARTMRLQQQLHWQHRETERVAGKRVLVVGTGPIGRAIASMLRGAGLRVSGIGRRARDDDPDFGTVYAADELTTHLPEADFVVAVAPLTGQTKGMFDADAFAAMNPAARFINVGRGELVVTDDLVAALREERIAGAALDVLDPEPLPANNPLWTMRNVFVSPHMAGDVLGWRETLVEVFVDNFHRWRNGEALRNVVDKQLGYVPSGN